MNLLKLAATPALIMALLAAGLTGCNDDSNSMDHGGMDHGGMNHSAASPSGMDHGAMNQSHSSTSMSVTHAVITMPASPDVTAGYLTIANNGAADTLLGVSTPVATAVEMHRTVNSGGTMKMEPMQNVPVPAHDTVQFSNGGMHLMLMKPKGLQIGQDVRLTLRFATAGEITVVAKVVPTGSSAMQH